MVTDPCTHKHRQNRLQYTAVASAQCKNNSENWTDKAKTISTSKRKMVIIF